NIAVSKRTTVRQQPHAQRPQLTLRLNRRKASRRRQHGRQSDKRTSLGNVPPLVASWRARARHARSVAVDERRLGKRAFEIQFTEPERNAVPAEALLCHT